MATTAPRSATPARGRPRQYDDATRERARGLYLLGDTPAEIAQVIGCTGRTIRKWLEEGQWAEQLRQRRATIPQLEAEIERLSTKRLTNGTADRLAKSTKALDRLRRAAPKPKPRPVVRNAVSTELLSQALSRDYGLYPYQQEFIQTDERFRLILKARQIGFSYVLGLAVLLGASAGRPQIVVSASETQARIILDYVRKHAERLEIPLEEDTKNGIKVFGTQIVAMSTNYRTAQGWPGDVWFDEFAWVRNQKLLWGAIVPSITQVGGRVTVCSTPFLPGSLFWRMATNHQGKYDYFRRWEITIQDAVAQGMPLPGGIEELRMLFDADTWAMFYECQWAEDGSALLGWDLLHSLTVPDISKIRVGRLRAGVDVGRTSHRFAMALTGQVLDEVTGKFTDRFAMPHWQLHKGLDFEGQRNAIDEWDETHEIDRWFIDRTGLGMNLSEDVVKQMPERAVGIHFDARKKERMARNIVLLAEQKRLILPNDPDVLAHFHSVKKIISGETVRYNAPSNEDGHGDLFWAAAMPLDGMGRNAHSGGDGGVVVEVW